VQVDPIKLALKAPGTERLKLKHDGPLSNFTFTFNLRRYTEVVELTEGFRQADPAHVAGGFLRTSIRPTLCSDEASPLVCNHVCTFTLHVDLALI
jgi:hypothetical protein